MKPVHAMVPSGAKAMSSAMPPSAVETDTLAAPVARSTSYSVAPATATTSTTSTGGDIYVVTSGDTLTKIAKLHGTTIKAIESENNLTTTKIKVGQKLKIPVKAEAPAPEPAPAAAPLVTPLPSSPAPAQ